MNSDSFMRIGSTHQICQDYVYEHPNGVALCDGCSSAKSSDIGARLLCHAMLTNKEDKLPEMVENLGLQESCLYATYLNIEQEGGQLLFTRYGDGFIALGLESGKVLLTEIKFSKNMPYYLAYRILGQENDFYTSSKWNNNNVEVMGYSFNPDLSLDWKLACTKGHSNLQNYEANSAISFLQDVKWCAILSDGLSAFIDRANDYVPVELVAKEIFSFKNFNGEFVKRRMRAAFKKFDELGWKNTDDFSIGVVHCERPT